MSLSPVGHGAVARGSAARGLSIGPLALWALGSGSGPLESWNVGRFSVGSGFNYWKPIRPERTEFSPKKNRNRTRSLLNRTEPPEI